MIEIILIEPEEPGNIGAIARVMKNFGFTSLILVNPHCNHLAEDARKRAKHGLDVLENAKVVKALRGYHTLIATTGRLGTDYNITRSPILPAQLPDLLPKNAKIGLLFGRESTGLHNEELEKCDFIVSVPASAKYPVLNISHAVAIILYELYRKQKGKSTDHFIQANANEKKQTLKLVNEILNTIAFPTQSMLTTQKKVWRRIIGKSALTHREAAALMGFFRRLLQKKS